jgi:hypothetical protein
VLQLADQHKPSYQQRPSGGISSRLTFAQKGKLGSATSQAPTPLNAFAKNDESREGKPHPTPCEKDPAGKMLANSLGKMKCFNCSGNNHWVINCPNLLATQHNVLAGMAHISVGKDILNGIGFLQNNSTNAAIVTTRKTLNPNCLFLDSMSSFYQVSTKEHLNNPKLDGVTLHACCNSGTNFATKKGWCQNLFHLWLVRNGIANFLSLPQLEEDSFTVSYQIGGEWIVTTPHGEEIIFHLKTKSICRGFPYLDMHSTAAVAMVQTICQRYKGFTKCKVLNTIAVRKA